MLWPTDLNDPTAAQDSFHSRFGRVGNFVAEASNFDSQMELFTRELAKLHETEDKVVQKYTDACLMGAMQLIVGHHKTLDVKKVSASQQFKADKIFVQLSELFEKWPSLKKHFGGPKDYLRTQALQQFILLAKEYLIVIGDLPRERWTFWWRKKIKRIEAAVRICPWVVAFFVTMIWFRRVKVGVSSLAYYGHKFWLQLGKTFGYSVEIEGRDRISEIQPNSGNKQIQLMVPTHCHPILDASICASLAVDNALFFMAADLFLPKLLADCCADADGFVVVGRKDPAPLDKMMQQLEEGRTNGILTYPEGCLGVGLGETLPLREKFSKELVSRLLARGFEVRLIPIVYMNASRFIDETSESRYFERHSFDLPRAERVLKAKVCDALAPEVVRRLMAYDPSGKLLNQVIREIWRENLPTDSKRFCGRFRSQEIIRQLKARKLYLAT